jgi:hypothetical protein
MIDNGAELKLEPARASVEDMSVTAQVRQVGMAWEVVVAFSRLNGMPPMSGNEVNARLFASTGESLDLLEAPHGLLPEFGGGLGTSVNARYRFDACASFPARLVIRYKATELSFRLTPAV